MAAPRYLTRDGVEVSCRQVNNLVSNVPPPFEQITTSATIPAPRLRAFFFTVQTFGSWKFSLDWLIELLTWRINRSFHSSFKTPTKSQSIVDRINLNIIMPTPRRGCFSYSAYRFMPTSGRVALLNYITSPPTVFRSVVTIVINPIKRVFWARLLAHICKKITKTISAKPSIINLYASSTVPMKTPVFLIKTSFFHGSPRVMFWLIFTIATMTIVSCIFAYRILISTLHATKESLFYIVSKFTRVRFLTGYTSMNYHDTNYMCLLMYCKGEPLCKALYS